VRFAPTDARLPGMKAPSSPAPSRRRIDRQAATRASELPDVLQFMRVLWEIAHGLQTRSKRMKREAGVTGPQRLVLRVVGLLGEVTAGQLAAILHVHPSTLTGVQQLLVVQGLLLRASSVADRRVAVLSLTPKGAGVNASRRGTVEGAVIEGLARVPARDRAAAQRVLAELARCLAARPGA
jgi:DNA-binding MarR family transcriptional regulator